MYYGYSLGRKHAADTLINMSSPLFEAWEFLEALGDAFGLDIEKVTLRHLKGLLGLEISRSLLQTHLVIFPDCCDKHLKLLGYKPYVISRDEEPVEMQNAFGEVIPVPGHWRVLFDTGNEVGTGISRELLWELNLQPDPNKKKKAKVIGELRQFETVQIVLIIRGHNFKVCALVDAVAEDTNLLVGMDIIQQLYDLGYTIGN